MPSSNSKLVNTYVEVQGYKHDGRMHRIWDSPFCVEDNEEYIVLVSYKTKVIEHDFRVWYTKESAVMIFFKHEWKNIIAMLKNNGITYYVNLASPYIIDSKFIKYVDYDLDMKLYPNNKIRLIDVKEYDFNRKRYGYGEDINKILRYNIFKIEKEMKKRVFPLDDNNILEYYSNFKKIRNIKEN